MKNDEHMNEELETSAPEAVENEKMPELEAGTENDIGADTASIEDGAVYEPEQLIESDTDSINGVPEITEKESPAVAEADGESADEDESEDAPKDEDTDEAALPSPEESHKTENEDKPRRVDSIFDFIELCVFTLAAVFIITSFFFRYSIVDGGSMQNTLQDNERLLLTNFLYTPECGDVVVVQDKSTELKDPIVKRVIAVGGQTVRFTRNDVYVDGIKLDEPYVYTGDYYNPFGGEDVYRYSVYPSDELIPLVTSREDGVYYEILIPEGEIFVMGDHRNVSKDSRDIGTLHEDAIIGKVVLRFYPFREFGKIE